MSKCFIQKKDLGYHFENRAEEKTDGNAKSKNRRISDYRWSTYSINGNSKKVNYKSIARTRCGTLRVWVPIYYAVTGI